MKWKSRSVKIVFCPLHSRRPCHNPRASGNFQAEPGEPENGFEYVSGNFSPSGRSLFLAGTHKSDAGHAMIGFDLYDIRLAQDGLTAEGRTLGNYEDWVHEFTATATCLAHPIEGVRFRGDAHC